QNPTRINLINTKKRMVIARKGHSILKKKREVLVLEFLKLLKQSKNDRAYLLSIMDRAYKTVTIASTYVGNFELEETALHVSEAPRIGVSVKNIMGVKIPEIYRGNESGRSFDYEMLSKSIAVDDIQNSFSKVISTVIEVAQREQGLRRIVLEVEKTKRRVNALDYVVIPNMKSEAKYIAMRLDEIDRDMFSALKHVKKKIAKREGK
ncbi:V-type ATP synthase subunit D, partial [Candidatus Marsarchaeota archaeon]|nr:V-type ATP synthase subunit D [Candidatus Marsarchaeota archaeon]